MKIYFATDHAGFEMKNQLLEFVRDELGYDVEDCGAFEYDAQDDYPEFMHCLAEKVARDAEKGVQSRGIILGGSGQGEAMVANRHTGVRATTYYHHNLEIIKLSRKHNNANVLSIGARFITLEQAKEAIQLWLKTEFSEDARHIRRIKKIDTQNEQAVFDEWNGVKKKTDNYVCDHYYKEGDVFFARLGKNIGFEQDGGHIGAFLRPILIVRGFNKNVFFAVALTTTIKDHPFYMSLGEIDGEQSVAILSQARLLDSKRLEYKIGHVSYAVLEEVRSRLGQVLLKQK